MHRFCSHQLLNVRIRKSSVMAELYSFDGNKLFKAIETITHYHTLYTHSSATLINLLNDCEAVIVFKSVPTRHSFCRCMAKIYLSPVYIYKMS